MKKSILIATLVVSTLIGNCFAAEEKHLKEVTARELISEGTTMGIEAALCYLYLEYLHLHLKPTNEKSSLGQTFDLGSKGFFAVLFGDQAKSFFQKLKAFTLQKSKPFVSPILEAF